MRRSVALWAVVLSGLLVVLSRGGWLDSELRVPTAASAGAAPPERHPGESPRGKASAARAPAPRASRAPAAAGPGPSRPAVAARSAWSSPEGCRQALRARARSTGPRPARIVAWNLEWFPDGVPGAKPKRPKKDLEWLACALALLDGDVFVFSEVKANARARAALDGVFRRLEALNGGSFRVGIDPCPELSQHVAVAWNHARVENRDLEVYGELNPKGAPCEGQLRPGYGGFFRFAGGLDLEVVGVHLKSGTDARSYELRRSSWAALGAVAGRARAARRDDDLLVLGDFNSMGCARCPERLSAEVERAELARTVAELVPLDVVPACTHYHHRRSGVLDLALARRGMRELPARARAAVAGFCAEQGCRPLTGDAPAAQDALSDHCPIVVELVDQDLD